jgi:hypothetical protein
MALGQIQVLTEMSTRNLSGAKGRPARKGGRSLDRIVRIGATVGNKCKAFSRSHRQGDASTRASLNSVRMHSLSQYGCTCARSVRDG